MEKLIIFPYSLFLNNLTTSKLWQKAFVYTLTKCIGEHRCFQVEFFLIENAIATIKQVIWMKLDQMIVMK